MAGQSEAQTEDLDELSSPVEETDNESQPGLSKKVKMTLLAS